MVNVRTIREKEMVSTKKMEIKKHNTTGKLFNSDGINTHEED
jgi:hypothetical protein